VNRIDAVILLVLAIYGFLGYRRGFLAVALDWLGLAIAVGAALRLFPQAGSWLIARYAMNPAVARVLGFIGLVLVVRLAWSVVVGLIWRQIPRVLRRSLLDRVAGILPGLMQGALICALGLVSVASLPLAVVPHAEIAASPLGSALLEWGMEAQSAVQRWVGGTVHDLISFRTEPLKPGERVDLPFKTTRSTPDPEAEAAMLHLVNSDRRQRGLQPMVMDERLRKVARAHAKDMLAHGYFAHTDPQGRDPFARLSAAGIGYLAAGENLAFAPSASAAHAGLMNSPGHRANILRPAFRRVGIGALRAQPYGIMFVQEFTN
jgi:uncharacterized protein YkwD/uncharacterized membrane protein required for colicin V production